MCVEGRWATAVKLSLEQQGQTYNHHIRANTLFGMLQTNRQTVFDYIFTSVYEAGQRNEASHCPLTIF